MKRKSRSLLATIAIGVFISISTSIFSQGVYNNGAKLIIPSGNYMHINNADYTNTTTSSTDGSITLNGNISIEGDWTNNADNELSLSAGTVTFEGSSTQNITGSSYTEFYNLTIASGADVEVPAGKYLTVNNALSMTGNLTLKSASSGGETVTASLIDGGSNSGNLTVELYLTGDTANHLVSSPVNNAALTSIYDPSNGNYNVYWYNEDQASVSLSDRWEREQSTLTNARGYTAVYTNATTREFSGTLSTGSDITINVTKAGSTSDDGWNLIGNPYPSPISANSFVTDNSSIDGTLYFWDDDGSNGSSYGDTDFASWNGIGSTSASAQGNEPGDYIPIGQGFFVLKSSTGTSSVAFKNSQRSHQSSSSYYFFTSSPKTFPRIKLSLTNPDDLYNEILIGFPEDATNAYDRLYDGKKLKGNSNMALYTIQNGTDYSIQGYAPLDQNSLSIPIGFLSGHKGDHTFKLELFENFDSYTKVDLEDKTQNKLVDLTQNAQYIFNSAAGEFNDRFVLHFNYEASGIRESDEPQLTLFTENSRIIIKTNRPVDGQITVVDMLGHTLYNTFQKQITRFKIDSDFPKGYYLVTIRSQEHLVTNKILIN